MKLLWMLYRHHRRSLNEATFAEIKTKLFDRRLYFFPLSGCFIKIWFILNLKARENFSSSLFSTRDRNGIGTWYDWRRWWRVESKKKIIYSCYRSSGYIYSVPQFVSCCYSRNVSKSWFFHPSRAASAYVWNDKSFGCLLWIAMFHKGITLTIWRSGDLLLSLLQHFFSWGAIIDVYIMFPLYSLCPR